MSSLTSQHTIAFNSVKVALTELKSGPIELRKFISAVFDELDIFIHKQLDREFAIQQEQLKAEREVMQRQLDVLTALMSQLTKTVIEQKSVTDK